MFRSLDLGYAQRRLYGADDALRDLVLQGEHVVEIAIEAVGPHVSPGVRLDQLRLPQAAGVFEQVRPGLLLRHFEALHHAAMNRRQVADAGQLAGAAGQNDPPAGDLVEPAVLEAAAHHLEGAAGDEDGVTATDATAVEAAATRLKQAPRAAAAAGREPADRGAPRTRLP